jgi:hypothetical protein
MMRVFRACPAPDGRLLGGSPWIDSGLLENQIPLQQRKKIPRSRFLRISVSKTWADSGICDEFVCGYAELAAELTAELQRN